MRLSGRGNVKNSLSPIDPEELLQSLKLTTGKAAEFCDISRRQLCYWTDKGIVETVEGDEVEELAEEGARRVYDYSALKRVLLIKQLLELGRGLKRATREVESYVQVQHSSGVIPDADRRAREETLQRQTERLEEIADQVRSAVQRGRTGPADLRQLAREIHYFLELMAHDDNATLHLQENAAAANQFRMMIDQLALNVEEIVAEQLPTARRNTR